MVTPLEEVTMVETVIQIPTPVILVKAEVLVKVLNEETDTKAETITITEDSHTTDTIPDPLPMETTEYHSISDHMISVRMIDGEIIRTHSEAKNTNLTEDLSMSTSRT